MIQFLKNVSLKPYNTFGIDQKASNFCEITTTQDLISLVKEGSIADRPFLVLGGGSNILLTKDFDGLVLKNGIKGIEVVEETGAYVRVKVGAGENWHEFVMYALDHHWAGVENLALIPGTVGAAPMQNIGAYGVEIKEVFHSLEAVDLSNGSLRVFDKAECAFGYRESVFKKELKDKYVITSVIFQLNKQPNYNTSYGAIADTLSEMGVQELSIRAIAEAVISIRQSKLPDPAEIGNSGSFFKNPVVHKSLHASIKSEFSNVPGYPVSEDEIKIPAAWLIEQAGWKGYRSGQIGVHQRQPLVLVNYGGGKGQDILALAKEIQKSVKEKFGVLLNPEVNII